MGPKLVQVEKKIEDKLTWLGPVKNPGQLEIKHG